MRVTFPIIHNLPKTVVTNYVMTFVMWIVVLFAFKIIFFSSLHQLDYSDSNFKVLGLDLPRDLEFCGERIPQNDIAIKDDLEKEFYNGKHWKSSAAMYFNRSQRWFPLIESILKKEEVPDDFKFVAVIESHLSNVVSPMGAAGFWQLLPNTARNYGLIVNDEVDERFDVERATYAACQHFKDAYQIFNNWTLSAAAYNQGIGGIRAALMSQNTSNYFDLLLNKETGSFVYRILAYKTLLSTPQHFGLNEKIKKEGKGYPAYKIVKVDSSITNLTAFAKKLETNLITLRTFNPWLIGDQLSNEGHYVYKFKIPKNKKLDISSYFNDVFPHQTPSVDQSNKIDSDTLVKLRVDTINKK